MCRRLLISPNFSLDLWQGPCISGPKNHFFVDGWPIGQFCRWSHVRVNFGETFFSQRHAVKPMLTEFGIHYRFEGCVEHKLTKSVVSIRSLTDSKLRDGVHSQKSNHPSGEITTACWEVRSIPHRRCPGIIQYTYYVKPRYVRKFSLILAIIFSPY